MRRINRCMNSKLQQICTQAVQLEELNQKINLYLPEFLRPQCQVGSFNKGCLVLVTTDSVWASQLRYSIPELRDKLRTDGKIPQLISIKITVTTPTAEIKSVLASQKIFISTRAREDIIRQAENCAYSPLKAALLHLAQKPPGCKILGGKYE